MIWKNLWSKQWLMKFNSSKTNYIMFSKKNRNIIHNPIILENQPVKCVKSLKHLGVIFDNKMNWSEHINTKFKEFGNRLNLLKRLPPYVSPYVKLKIYTTYIRPILEYGSVLFDGCSKELSCQLEQVQRQAMIVITKCYHNTSNEKILQLLALQPLYVRPEKAKLSLLYKILHDMTQSYLKTLILGKVGDNITYNLRNAKRLKQYKIKQQYFLKSYIPSTITLWNNLDSTICDETSLLSFRK